MKIEFLLLCIFLFWAGLAKQKWKVSKAMENNLKAKKEIFKEQGKLNAEYNEYSEAKLKMKNIKTKSFNDLQQIFYPDDKQCRSNLSRNLSSLALQENKGECLDYEPRWVRLICMKSNLKQICNLGFGWSWTSLGFGDSASFPCREKGQGCRQPAHQHSCVDHPRH